MKFRKLFETVLSAVVFLSAATFLSAGNAAFAAGISRDAFSSGGAAVRGAEVKHTSTDDAFEIKDGVLIKYHGTASHVSIPETVKVIGKETFYNCRQLSTVFIPNTVTSIGERAFGNLYIKEIILPDSVTSLDEAAFRTCAAAEELRLPKNITSIPVEGFGGCLKLKEVIVPDGVTILPSAAFSNCRSLPSITLPASITDIESMAFANCDVFKVIYFKGTQQQWDVCIPSGLTAIGSGLKYQWYFKKKGQTSFSIWNGRTHAS